jgi:hypothetical protein
LQQKCLRLGDTRHTRHAHIVQAFERWLPFRDVNPLDSA